MAFKIEIVNNALSVTETISGDIAVFQPNGYTWYEEDSLVGGFVKFYGTTDQNEKNTNKYEYNKTGNSFKGFPITECVDSGDVVFTAETFRAFASLNLGKSSPTTGAISNITQVLSLSDLPTPVGDVITLDTDGQNYQFIEGVDLGGNRIVVDANNVKFFAINPATDGITSSTTGVFITANNGLAIDNMFIVGFSASKLIEAIGTGVEILTVERTTFIGGNSQIETTDFDVVAYTYSLFSSTVDSIKAFGVNRTFLTDTCLFRDITGTAVDIGTATFRSIGFDLCTCTNTATTTFLNIAPNSANIISGGEGTITDCKIDTSAGGISSTGTSPLDSLWSYTGNNTIKTSDRVLPTGWEVSFDGLATTPTLVLTSTPSLLTIDGAGANSNSTKLPNAIQGVTNLWDTVNNCIKPVVEGDSYDLRVQVNIQNLSGGASELTLDFDIGGQATPTIIIAEDTRPIKGLTKPVIFSFPVYNLATFTANGGQIFLNTDSGTATISTRSVLIVRTSSGAN